MIAARTNKPTIADAIDQLNQISDELKVAWGALTNPNHAEELVTEIGEHVNGLANRLGDTISLIDATRKAAQL